MANLARTTRRRFLGGAAAAIAAPYIVSSAALGAGRRRAASERITVGVIGVGNMGGGHVPGLLGNLDVQVVAICDVDGVKRNAAVEQVEKHYAAEKTAGTFKGCEGLHLYEGLLARKDIDAVLIAVPDHWHAIIAIAACRAGKDVYCEKPLALTIADAWEMVAAARRYNRVFQTGSQQRSDAKFRLACELVRNGRIGELKTVNYDVQGPSQDKFLPEEPVRPSLDWERWLGPAPLQPYNAQRCSGDYGGGWRDIRDYSGGMSTDWGAHHIDIAQWGMGTDGSGPRMIVPPPRVPATRERVDPSKEQTLTMTYESGVKLIHGGASGVLFTGTEGTIEVNRGYFKTTPESIGKSPLRPGDLRLYKSDNHVQNWIDCIRTRSRPIADVAIGASSVTVCHLANIAFWTGRTIQWDPKKREIIGDPIAARWLDRPKRAPYRLHA